MNPRVPVETLPEVFAGVEDFEITPDGIELAQATFNEDGLYQAIIEMAHEWFRTQSRPARILDLCSATGLCALRVSQAIPTEVITLVDIDSATLDVGMRRHFANGNRVNPVCADAVTYRDDTLYDLVLMNSAYHHIGNDRKVDFLRNAARQLAPDGAVLVGDHFLPPYHNWAEYRRSVVAFYTELVDALRTRNEPTEAIDVIRRAGLFCWQGHYEYKVSEPLFVSDIASAGFAIQKTSRVWVPRASTSTGSASTSAVWLARV
jgi:SAM-dependent methyltransferase